MEKITISMPDSMSGYVKHRLANGQYGSISEYFRDLIRKDQTNRQAEEDLRRMMVRAEASGMSERSEDEIFAEAVTDVKSRGLLRD